MTEKQNKLAQEIADCIYANSFHAPDGSYEPRLDSNPPAIYLLQEALAALRREPATEAVLEKEFDTLHKQLTEVRATVDEIETILDGRALKGKKRQ